MSFRTAAEKFRLIDDKEQVSLIVPYESAAPDVRNIAPLIERLRAGRTDRWLLRALQRHTVQVRRSASERLAAARRCRRGAAGLVRPAMLAADDGRGTVE